MKSRCHRSVQKVSPFMIKEFMIEFINEVSMHNNLSNDEITDSELDKEHKIR